MGLPSFLTHEQRGKAIRHTNQPGFEAFNITRVQMMAIVIICFELFVKLTDRW